MRWTRIMILAFSITVLTLLTHATAVEKSRTLVVQLTGKDIGETRSIPQIAATGTAEGNCFDVDLFDVRAGKALGTATRCFADVHTVGTGMALTDTIFFHLPEGTLVSRSRTTVQPAIDSSPEVTHVAVALPDAATNAVLADAGSGPFQGVMGRTRLAGVMDMRQFQERNEIAFNDLFVIELEEVNRDARIRQIQQQLQAAGFYSGAIDGLLGPGTKTALRQYQAKHGLPTTGELDEATRKALDAR
jgi:putative peptidoglycan binding protein